MNYYNDNDPFVVAWLRQLIDGGHLPPGIVDHRSIVDVQASDLEGYDQCHFFAGIGGWPLALALAGWPGEREVWTASCPCQPLSRAGRHAGHADERHLWPALHLLIAQRRPAAIFGEQVASRDGREWLAGVRADLAADGYACGAADLAAAGAGAPHIRQRLYWMGHPLGTRLERHAGHGDDRHQSERLDASAPRPAAPASSPWDRYARLSCTDGRTRRTEPGLFPLAHGVPGRVGRLRGYGNAIVPALAALFITAADLTLEDTTP